MLLTEKTCKDQLRNHIANLVAVVLNPEEEEIILECFRMENFNSKTLVQSPGNPCHFEYFVIKGLFQHSQLDQNGKKFTLSFPHENWWAGDYKSFRDSKITAMSLITLEQTVVLKISRADYFHLLKVSSVFKNYISRLSENNSVSMQSRVIDDMALNLNSRYDSFLKKYPHLENRLSQKMIASYLGVSQEHLSKTLGNRKESLKH